MIKIDATNQSIGRLASWAAQVLRGKNKVGFMPNRIGGEPVLIYNGQKVKVTGNKLINKKYYRHSGYLGHLREISLKDNLNKNPRWVIRHAIAGMLPKNRLRRRWLKMLTVR